MSEQETRRREMGMEPEEASLWQVFVQQRDPAMRTDLIVRYMQTAKRIAASMYAQRPFAGVEFADYLQYARVGLLEAIDRFDPGRGASFSTYATYRIRGSILNGIESNSELAAQGAYRRRAAKERVLSVHTASENAEADQQFAALAQTAIDLALGYVLEDSGIQEGQPPSDDNELYNVCELRMLRERLVRIVDALPERERRIIRGHYFEHLEFSALAAELDLTKGRISQLHARGLAMVREAYRALTGFDMSI